MMFYSGKLKHRASVLTMVIMTVGLVMSHYSTAFVYLALLSIVFLFSRFSRRRIEFGPIRITLLAIVATTSYFIFAAGGVAFVALSANVVNITRGISTDLFGGQRPVQLMLALGAVAGQSRGILHDMNRMIQILVQFFLVLGFFALALKKKKSEADYKFIPLITFGMLFLGASVALPFVAGTLNITRIYHYALILISPCLIFGIGVLDRRVRAVGSTLQRFVHTDFSIPFSTKQLMAGIILCSYFLFVSGWVFAVAMDTPSSIILDSNAYLNSTDMNIGAIYFNTYAVLPDIAAARWISEYRQMNRPICSDQIAQYGVLDSYGELPRGGPLLSYCRFQYSYVYLREYNSLYGYVVLDLSGRPTFMSTLHISNTLAAENRIYSGTTVVYSALT